MSIDLYTKERAEEWRLKLNLMNSTLMQTKELFRKVCLSNINDSHCPPFLYPTLSFSSLEKKLKACFRELNKIKINGRIDEYVLRLGKLHENSSYLLTEIVRLQNVFAQRTSVLGSMDLIEFNPIEETEYGIVLKAYNAVDSLTYDLVERTLGERWIEHNKFVPISLFDYEGYSINRDSFIISVPYYDSFRCRFWAALAHEIGHIVISEQLFKERTFQLFFIKYIEKLIKGFKLPENIALLQIIELACDVISVYVCPPAIFTGAYIIPFPFEYGGNDDLLTCIYSTHPPSDSRLIAMNEILSRQRLKSDINIANWINSVIDFHNRKNLFISHEFWSYITRYNNFARKFAQDLLNILYLFNIKPFTVEELDSIKGAWKNNNLDQLSPVQIIVLLWILRLSHILKSKNGTLKDFFKDRKNEINLYNYIVHFMFNYYDTKIYSKFLEMKII